MIRFVVPVTVSLLTTSSFAMDGSQSPNLKEELCYCAYKNTKKLVQEARNEGAVYMQRKGVENPLYWPALHKMPESSGVFPLSIGDSTAGSTLIDQMGCLQSKDKILASFAGAIDALSKKIPHKKLVDNAPEKGPIELLFVQLERQKILTILTSLQQALPALKESVKHCTVLLKNMQADIALTPHTNALINKNSFDETFIKTYQDTCSWHTKLTNIYASTLISTADFLWLLAQSYAQMGDDSLEKACKKQIPYSSVIVSKL